MRLLVSNSSSLQKNDGLSSITKNPPKFKDGTVSSTLTLLVLSFFADHCAGDVDSEEFRLPKKRKTDRDFEVMFGAEALGTSSVFSGESTATSLPRLRFKYLFAAGC